MVLVQLSWNERVQIIDSIRLMWKNTASEQGAAYKAHATFALMKLRSVPVGRDAPVAAFDFTEDEAHVITDGLQYQRNLVQYENEKAPAIGEFGPATRFGPAEIVHIGPLIRKFAKAMGEITEETNPELVDDPPYQ